MMSDEDSRSGSGGVLAQGFVRDMGGVPLDRSKKGAGLRHKFSKGEDEQLKKLVAMHGENNWVVVAGEMNNRTPRQCRERYKNYLSPLIKNGPWTPEEEQLLERKVKECGPRWAKIALCFEHRSDVNVKNHWTAMSNRQMKDHQSVEVVDSIAAMDRSARQIGMVPEMGMYYQNQYAPPQYPMQQQAPMYGYAPMRMMPQTYQMAPQPQIPRMVPTPPPPSPPKVAHQQVHTRIEMPVPSVFVPEREVETKFVPETGVREMEPAQPEFPGENTEREEWEYGDTSFLYDNADDTSWTFW
jgi:hypothetical protein